MFVPRSGVTPSISRTRRSGGSGNMLLRLLKLTTPWDNAEFVNEAMATTTAKARHKHDRILFISSPAINALLLICLIQASAVSQAKPSADSDRNWSGGLLPRIKGAKPGITARN